TTGDKRHDVSLASIGGKGLFIKELEEALERETIDIAVHSLKDVPSIVPEQFKLAAFLERADPRDAWLQRDGTPLSAMPAGSVVGTSAPRRRAQLLARHPHLKIEPIRGNVDTRVKKMRSGEYDGVVLALAGLTRLGRDADASAIFSVEEMLPAAGQGIVAIESLRDIEVLRRINHHPSETAALSERGVLQAFGERLDCYSCIAVHAIVRDDRDVHIRAFMSDSDAKRVIRAEATGDRDRAVAAVAEQLMRQGATELLKVSA
ncbi:MAG: hydroxymethylbilane synthase, partial [Thermoanaerobaculia bacterium]